MKATQPQIIKRGLVGYYLLTVFGHAMENYSTAELAIRSIPDKAAVLAQPVAKAKWQSDLTDDKEYAIVLKDSIFIGHIVKNENGYITACAINADKTSYPDLTIAINDCDRILQIVSVTNPYYSRNLTLLNDNIIDNNFTS